MNLIGAAQGWVTLLLTLAALALEVFAFIDLLIRVRLSKGTLLAQWVLFGLACPLAALVNPYGLQTILAGGHRQDFVADRRCFAFLEDTHRARVVVRIFVC